MQFLFNFKTTNNTISLSCYYIRKELITVCEAKTLMFYFGNSKAYFQTYSHLQHLKLKVQIEKIEVILDLFVTNVFFFKKNKNTQIFLIIYIFFIYELIKVIRFSLINSSGPFKSQSLNSISNAITFTIFGFLIIEVN